MRHCRTHGLRLVLQLAFDGEVVDRHVVAVDWSHGVHYSAHHLGPLELYEFRTLLYPRGAQVDEWRTCEKRVSTQTILIGDLTFKII